MIRDLKKTTPLHHAYVVSGSAEEGARDVLDLLEERGIKTKGNPDVLSFSFPELLVDHVRDMLLPFASLKPLHERKYLIVSFTRANDAAQNALLKAVEESVGHTVFFFCVDTPGSVLPTLRSRCVMLSRGESHVREESGVAQDFLKESYEKRLARVDQMAGYVSKTQDRSEVRSFVKELLSLAHDLHASPQALRDLLDADRYLKLPGSSVKSILGHLAVSLPRE